MTWLKIDDGVRTHPKIVRAGPAAAWQWFCGNCYCRQHLTDGFIPAGMLASLVPGVNEREAKKLATVLVNANLWHVIDGGYQVHDFLDWNPSRKEVLAKRAEDRHRKDAGLRKDSGEIPSGQIAGLRKDSGEIPSGQIKDSLLTRDGRADLSSVSPLGGICSLEGGSGETGPKPIISGQATPRGWGKIHSEHVTGFCGWVCLPEFLAMEFQGKSGEGKRSAAYVLAWALEIRRTWEGKKIGEDNLKFWRARWAESHTTVTEKPKFSIADAIARKAAER